VWLLVIVVAAVAWWAFIQQIILGRPFGSNAGSNVIVWIVFLVFGVGMVWLLFSLKLTTSVKSDRVCLRFSPLCNRKISLADIKSCTVREYRSFLDYGGWGIRWSPSRGMAYNVSGNRGVQLELHNGKKVLIGSQKTDELMAALSQAIGR